MIISIVIVLGEAFEVAVKNVGNKANLKRLGSKVYRSLILVNDDRKRLNLPKKNTKSSIEAGKKDEKQVRKCSKIRCCFKFCCPLELYESDEDTARSSEDDTEANSTRNNETQISVNVNIIPEKENSNFDGPRAFCAVRRPPNFTVGLDMPVRELKALLLKEEVRQLLLTAPAGCGKTTLVQMLCQDKQIKAFLQDESSYIPEEDIKKIVRGCGGCPLALKMIGSSLCGQHAVVWHSRLLKWSESDGKFFFNSDTELLPHLQKSLEFPDDKIIIKECFLDLCSFGVEQRIPAAILIDMWAELYELDEDGIHAIANMQELSIRNLAELVMTRKDASEVISYYNEDFVTQHHIFRELALHQSSQEPIGQRLRLIMNISGNNLPKWWMEKKQQLINARLLSISTDESFLWSWCNIQAPKVEVLILNFQTKNYTLPEFVEKTNELKVLIVSNYGSFHTEIKNFQLLWSLPNLKRIRLEKISISSLCETLVPLKSLRKISLFMCNIGKAFENCTIKVSDALPNLKEINIDYCNELVELPVGLSDIVHLKKLYITNCHKLSILPKGIGNLVNLEVLRIRSCTDLSKLPESIRNLHKLSILDISDCLSISKLPKYIGELCNLEVLNMKGCLRLCNPLPESTIDLKQLKIVVCDEERAKLWEPIKNFLAKLKIEVAKKDINLNWLLK